MKERPILFSGEMVRAILAGNKTQTRRLLKPQPSPDLTRHCWFSAPVYGFTKEPQPAGKWFKVKSPHGSPGDRLWVRETFRSFDDGDTFYKADFGDWIPVHADDDSEEWRWQSPYFMPRRLSRIMLEITDVRMQKVQDITEEDAQAEGVDKDCPIGHIPSYQKSPYSYCFARLWDSIHGAGAWERNDWVWAYTFRRLYE
jgi:hypothetical protein